MISILISDFGQAKASMSVPMQTWLKCSNCIWKQPVEISNYVSHKSNNFVCMGLLLTKFCLRRHCHSITHTILTDASLLQIHIFFRVLWKTTHGLSKTRGPGVDMTQSLHVTDSLFLTMVLWAKPLFGESERSFLQPEIDLFFKVWTSQHMTWRNTVEQSWSLPQSLSCAEVKQRWWNESGIYRKLATDYWNHTKPHQTSYTASDTAPRGPLIQLWSWHQPIWLEIPQGLVRWGHWGDCSNWVISSWWWIWSSGIMFHCMEPEHHQSSLLQVILNWFNYYLIC